MKIVLKSLLFLGLVLCFGENYAQSNNMGVGDPVVSPQAVVFPSTHSIQVSFFVQNSYTVNSTNNGRSAIIISLGKLKGSAESIAAATGTLASKMAWSYNSGSNTFVGRWILGQNFAVLTQYSIQIPNLPATEFVPKVGINLGLLANLTPPLGISDPSTANNAASRYTYHSANCPAFRTLLTGSGLWSDNTNWEKMQTFDTWIPTTDVADTPTRGSMVVVRHLVNQNIDFNVFNCPLILDSTNGNTTSKLVIDPQKTLSFGGGVDGNAYFNLRPVVVKSTLIGTGAIGQMLTIARTPTEILDGLKTTSATFGDQNVTLERYIPGSRRRWNLLTLGVDNGTAVNINNTIRDGWAGGSRARVSNSSNTNAGYPYGTPDPNIYGVRPDNTPFPAPVDYVAGDGTIITGHSHTDAATANGQGYDWWRELVIPAGTKFWNLLKTGNYREVTAAKTVTTPSSIRPYRPGSLDDPFGALPGVNGGRGTEWISNEAVNTGFNGGSLINVKLSDAEQGYMLYTRGDRMVLENWFGATTLRPTGKIRSFNKTVSINPSATQAYTVLGNPYPAPIDMEKVFNANTAAIATNYHYWDSYQLDGANGQGSYRTVSRLGSNSWVIVPTLAGTNPQYVSSSQAILVEGTAAGGTLTFTEDMKAPITGVQIVPFDDPGGSSSTPAVLFANYSNRDTAGTLSLVDGVAIVLGNDYHADLSDGNDVRKPVNFTSRNGIVALVRDTTWLAIEAYPTPTTESVFPMYTPGLYENNFSFNFYVKDLYKEGREAFLRDKFLNTLNPISIVTGTQYDFAGTSDTLSTKSDRFEIVFKQSTILPVNFTKVQAVEQNRDVLVSWQVATEKNVSHYEVEHSLNGVDFGKAVRVEAKNTSPAEYDWLHVQPGAGVHFYRIRGVDTDGANRLSQIVKVTIGDATPAFTAYPTVIPQTRQVTVEMTSMKKGSYTLQVTDMSGRVLSARTMQLNGSSAEVIQLPLGMAAGRYNIRLIGESGNFINVIVKD